MSKGIKTKTTVKDVKALDKSAVAAERMKQAYIRTKDKAEHGMYAEESSPAEYASDRFSSGVDTPSKATPAIVAVKTVTRLVTMKSMGMELRHIN